MGIIQSILFKGGALYTASASGSLASPRPKKRRLVLSRASVEKEKTPEAVFVEDNEAAQISPSQTDIGTREILEVKNVVGSPILIDVVDLEEDNPSDDRHTDIFVPRPYISKEKMPVTVKDSAMANNQVGFALATSMTLHKDNSGCQEPVIYPSS